MKVFVLHLDEDTQVCSTMKKAIEAAKQAILYCYENCHIDSINVDKGMDFAEIRYIYKFADDDIYYEQAWIYAYEVDGGPIC